MLVKNKVPFFLQRDGVVGFQVNLYIYAGHGQVKQIRNFNTC